MTKMKNITKVVFMAIVMAIVFSNTNFVSAQTQTVSLGQRYAVNGKVVENPWGGAGQLNSLQLFQMFYLGYTFNVAGPTPAQISESSCPFGSALVGFNLYNMGNNYSTSGSLYCRPITFSSTAPVFDFSIGHGGNKTVVAGTDVVNMINTSLTSGETKDVSLSVVSITNSSNTNVMDQANGIFVPTSNSFSSGSVRPTGSSELTLNTQTSTPVGTYTVTVKGTSAGTTGAGAGVIMECVSTINDAYEGNGKRIVQLSCLGFYPSDTSIELLKTQDESMLYAASEANNTNSIQNAKDSVVITTNAWLNKLCDMSDNGVRDASDSIKYIGISNLGSTQIYNPVQTSLVWGGKTYAACASTITSSPINYQIVSVPNRVDTIQLTSGGGSGTSGLSKTTSFTVNVIANPYNLAITKSAKSCYSSELSQTATWNAYQGATSYNVYRKAGNTVLATMSTTSTTYIEKPTQIGKVYEYQVAAVVGGVEQARSQPVTLDSQVLETNCPSPSPSGGGGGGALVASCSVSPTSIIAGRNTTVTITGNASGPSGIEYSFDDGRNYGLVSSKTITTSTGGSYSMKIRSTGNVVYPDISCGTVTVKSVNLSLSRKQAVNENSSELTTKKGKNVYLNLANSGSTDCQKSDIGWTKTVRPLNLVNIFDGEEVSASTVGDFRFTITCDNGESPDTTSSVILHVINSAIEEI